MLNSFSCHGLARFSLAASYLVTIKPYLRIVVSVLVLSVFLVGRGYAEGAAMVTVDGEGNTTTDYRDGQSYTRDENGACTNSSNTNDPDGKICLRSTDGICEYVDPQKAQELLASGWTIACDANCTPMRCIPNGMAGASSLPCCDAAAQAASYQYPDNNERHCSVPPNPCISERVSIDSVRSLGLEWPCCDGLIEVENACVRPGVAVRAAPVAPNGYAQRPPETNTDSSSSRNSENPNSERQEPRPIHVQKPPPPPGQSNTRPTPVT